MAINSIDILVRTQLTSCKFGELVNDYVNTLKYGGRKNTAKLKFNLILLNIYLNILCEYNVDSDYNCFDEDELKDIVEKVSILTGLCFQPYGYSYKG